MISSKKLSYYDETRHNKMGQTVKLRRAKTVVENVARTYTEFSTICMRFEIIYCAWYGNAIPTSKFSRGELSQQNHISKIEYVLFGATTSSRRLGKLFDVLAQAGEHWTHNTVFWGSDFGSRNVKFIELPYDCNHTGTLSVTACYCYCVCYCYYNCAYAPTCHISVCCRPSLSVTVHAEDPAVSDLIQISISVTGEASHRVPD